MRKFAAAVAGVSLSAIALTGCTVSVDDAAQCERVDTVSPSNLGTFKGTVGESPDVTLFSPITTTTTKVADLVTGKGRALTSDRQIAVLDFALYDGATGTQLFATEFNGDMSRVTNITTLTNTFPKAAEILKCATVGSRVVAAIPAKDMGEQAITGLGLSATSSVVVVFDVNEAEEPSAQGTLRYNDAAGMPSIVRAPDGRPGVIVPDAAAPTKVRTETLIEGDGAAVGDEDGMTWVDVIQVAWNDRSVVNNSWDTNPTSADSLPEDVQKAVAQATIGSQLLVVVPAADKDSSAMVYVVDVLGVAPTPQQ